MSLDQRGACLMTERRVDPITLEILSHKMWQVADEAGITVRRVSGSVVTIEAKDMIAALCKHNTMWRRCYLPQWYRSIRS
jgi:hypothetical protein